ncbi:hypothetical protein [Lapidilactobacillus salsurivasis]
MVVCLLCGQSFTPRYSLKQLLVDRHWYLDRLCPLCLRGFQPLDRRHACPQCGRLSEQGQRCYDCQRWALTAELLTNRALFTYNEAMQAYFQQYKGVGDYRLRLVFAGHLQAVFTALPRRTLIIPIPTSPSHWTQRQFDPVLGLIESVSRPDRRLASQEQLQHQAQLTRQERLVSPQHFYCPQPCPSADQQRPVLLVDDIYTTGRTLRHGQAALRQAGYQGEITSLTVAR